METSKLLGAGKIEMNFQKVSLLSPKCYIPHLISSFCHRILSFLRRGIRDNYNYTVHYSQSTSRISLITVWNSSSLFSFEIGQGKTLYSGFTVSYTEWWSWVRSSASSVILQVESGTTGKTKLCILDINVKIKRVGEEKNILLLWKQKETEHRAEMSSILVPLWFVLVFVQVTSK